MGESGDIMTIDLEKLRALEKAATPGPWWSSDPAWSLDEEADTHLVCAMRNSMPELLDEVEALREAALDMAQFAEGAQLSHLDDDAEIMFLRDAFMARVDKLQRALTVKP